jgi:hypothetical protein
MIDLQKIEIKLHSADSPKFLGTVFVTVVGRDGTTKTLAPMNLNNGDTYTILFGDS